MTLNILETKIKAPTKLTRKKLKLELLQTKEDRKNLENFIKTFIHSLDVESHNENSLCNVYTGEIAAADVNVNKAFEIGQGQLKSFKESLPEGFRSTIKQLVVPNGSKTKRRSKATTEESYDTELLFARVIYLLSTGEIKFEDLFDFELSRLPTSLCNEMGEPRYTKANSVLQTKLKVETSLRLVNFNVVVIDGLGMLHGVVHWPKHLHFIYLKYLHFADVYLIFDRYYNYSIKSNTRTARVKSFARGHNLFRQSPLPSKDDTLSCAKSKVQLIQQISAGLVDIGLTNKNHLVITSNDHCTTELKDGKKTLRSDLGTGHEEADNIIIQQINQMGQQGCSINVICDEKQMFLSCYVISAITKNGRLKF